MILYFRLIEMDKDLDLFQVGGGEGDIGKVWVDKEITLINFFFL
jgi:hypothetical protein